MISYGQLGRIKSVVDERTLKVGSFYTTDPSVIPATWDMLRQLKSCRVYGNDRYGNCVIATAAHLIAWWMSLESCRDSLITDESCISLSKQMGATNGYSILDRLKYWRNNGMWSNHTWAFASFDPSNELLMRQAIFVFGGADIGLALPLAWRNQSVWIDGSGCGYKPGSWGLHSVPVVGYNEKSYFILTWGRVQEVQREALHRFCDEAYCLINPEWFISDAQTPSNLDLERLHDELVAITGRSFVS